MKKQASEGVHDRARKGWREMTEAKDRMWRQLRLRQLFLAVEKSRLLRHSDSSPLIASAGDSP